MIPFDKIKVGPFDISVVSLFPEDKEECLGQFSPFDLTVELREDYTTQQQEAETLLHELLHAIWYTMAIAAEREVEEKVVGPMSVGLAMVIRDNPDLINWIREKLL